MDIRNEIVEHTPWIRRCARRYSTAFKVKHTEDLVQDIYVELFRSADQYDPEKGTVANWVGMKSKFVFWEHYKRMMRPCRRGITESIDVGPIWELTCSTVSWMNAIDLPSFITDKVAAHQLMDKLKEMKPERKSSRRDLFDIVFLKLFCDIEESQIADLLGCSKMTVNRSYHKAINYLKKCA